MKPKKTWYVSTVIILNILSIVMSAVGFFVLYKTLTNGYVLMALSLGGGGILTNTVLTLLILSILNVILQVVYLVKLFRMSKGLISWTHVVFGLNVGISITSITSSFIKTASVDIAHIVFMFVLIFIWLTFVKHLKNINYIPVTPVMS